MRKIFTKFSSISLSLIMILSIVACYNQFNNLNIYRITVVTDGHSIDDASFNESSYKAANEFKEEFNKWTDSAYVDHQYKNKRVEVSWDNPVLTNIDSLMAAYSKAVFIKSKVIIAAGFLHHNALVKAQNTSLKHKVKFIFVDGDTRHKEVPEANKQLAGLLYKSEQSGFLAGLAGAIWLTANYKKYGGLENLKMSTYGGIDIPPVTSYMYGYYWAIQFFNSKNKDKKVEEKLKSWVKILNPDFKQSLPNINFITSATQFSGNFTQGSKGSQAINDDLARQKTNIIFPVAGPQTEDTLSSLKKIGQDEDKIIGVDTDQQLQYPQFANRFITSAQKDLINSIKIMLWKSVGKTDKYPKHESDPDANKAFTEDAPYRGGHNFTGIAPNKAIKDGDKDIYSPLMTETTNWLEKVSVGWQRVMDLKGEYWTNGIKEQYNPFK